MELVRDASPMSILFCMESAPRLSPDDWLDHGLNRLARHGPETLKADLLARSLGVSRGSFYWHFKSLAAFKRDLLERWRQVSTNALIVEVERAPRALDRFRAFMARALSDRGSLERAIRAWAIHSAEVRQTVAAVDAIRLDYLTRLLVDSGLSPDEAHARAVFAYAANLGRAQIYGRATASLDGAAIDALARLLLTPGRT